MQTHRLILNGKSAADPAVRAAIDAVRGEGALIDVRVTWEAGQAALFAREAAEQGIDVVIAAGGDGTVNEIVQGLLNLEVGRGSPYDVGRGSPDPAPRPTAGLSASATARSGDLRRALVGRGSPDPALRPTAGLPVLSILPLGTANDLARSLGLPLDDPTAALRLAVTGDTMPLDVGLVNGRPFVNVASGGFASEVTARTPPGLKNALGSAAYSITGLFTAPQLTPHPCRVIADGQSLELPLMLLAIGNGRLAGGGYEVAPQAKFDDGLLDLVLVPAVPLGELPTLLGEMFNASHAENQYILYRQLAAFELHFENEFQLNLDGEPLRAKDFSVTVRPDALRVVVGRGSPTPPLP